MQVNNMALYTCWGTTAEIAPVENTEFGQLSGNDRARQRNWLVLMVNGFFSAFT